MLMFWWHNQDQWSWSWQYFFGWKNIQNFFDLWSCIQNSIWCKAFIFDKVDGFIRKYDETKYLALFHFDSIRYLTLVKSKTSHVYSHKIMKIKINPDHGLLLEKTLNMHNVVMLVKSVFNKNHNHCYNQVFLGKWSYK